MVIAIAGAATFGASDVIEQRATHNVTKRPPLDLKLFADLAANRLWVIGITVDIAGSVCRPSPWTSGRWRWCSRSSSSTCCSPS